MYIISIYLIFYLFIGVGCLLLIRSEKRVDYFLLLNILIHGYCQGSKADKLIYISKDDTQNIPF